MPVIKRYDLLKKTIENEIVVTEYFYKTQSLKASDYSFLPGISRYSRTLKKIKIASVLLNIVYFFWPIIIMPFLNVILFFMFLIKKIKNKNRLINKKQKSVLFASSMLAKKIATRAIENNFLIVFRPSCNSRLELNCECNSLVLLSYKDLFEILLKSIFFSIVYSYGKDTKRYRLFTFAFFEILVVEKAFDYFDEIENLYTTDHFDRWAVLLDVIKYKKRIQFKKLNLIQHGMLYNISDTGDVYFPFALKQKLHNLDKLYCFDEKSVGMFKDNVIVSDNRVEWTIFDNKLLLKSCEKKDGETSILIIGNALCFEFQKSLASFLMISKHKESVVIYYKPHPVQNSKNLDKYEWLVIDDKNYYPDVDIVVSYPSTLAFQYIDNGSKVLIHQLNEPLINIEKVIKEITRNISIN